jgi:hypothetical protein
VGHQRKNAGGKNRKTQEKVKRIRRKKTHKKAEKNAENGD